MANLILVTGGLGFIGSHTVLKLIDFGYSVIIVDNCCNSDASVLHSLKQITNKDIIFYNCDICNQEEINSIFKKHRNIYAVIHFAALKSVSESITSPHLYYYNNIISLNSIINAMKIHNCNNLIFSSSATVYGKQESPIKETATIGKDITNPYGETKYICEQILKKVSEDNTKINIICLRYFNPCGAHQSGLLGEKIDGSNLMPNIMNSFINNKKFYLFGKNYNTTDGTAIRDFIHIDDLVYGHIVAIKGLNQSPNYKVYNLGTGNGYTVLEVINKMNDYLSEKINIEIKDKRAGDVECVYADPSKIYKELGWKAKKTLDDICKDTVNYINTSL